MSPRGASNGPSFGPIRRRGAGILFALVAFVALGGIAAIAWDATDRAGESLPAHIGRLLWGLFVTLLAIPLCAVTLAFILVAVRGALVAIRTEFFPSELEINASSSPINVDESTPGSRVRWRGTDRPDATTDVTE